MSQFDERLDFRHLIAFLFLVNFNFHTDRKWSGDIIRFLIQRGGIVFQAAGTGSTVGLQLFLNQLLIRVLKDEKSGKSLGTDLEMVVVIVSR